MLPDYLEQHLDYLNVASHCRPVEAGIVSLLVQNSMRFLTFRLQNFQLASFLLASCFWNSSNISEFEDSKCATNACCYIFVSALNKKIER
jgi:hypothetical protein